MSVRRFLAEKPSYPAEIDWSNPLSDGLVFFSVFNTRMPVDLVTGVPGSAVNSPTQSASIDGMVAKYTGASAQYHSFPNRPKWACTTNGQTIFARVYPASSGSFYSILGKSTGPASTGGYELLLTNGTPAKVGFLRNNTAANARSFTGSLNVNSARWNNISASWADNVTTTVPTMMVNGIVDPTITPGGGTPVGAMTDGGQDIRIGHRSNADIPLTGQVSVVAIWHRALSVAELSQVHAYPFALLPPLGTRFGRSFLNYTMTAETGAFALTGNAASFGISMPAGVGEFALTGSNADLIYAEPPSGAGDYIVMARRRGRR